MHYLDRIGQKATGNKEESNWEVGRIETGKRGGDMNRTAEYQKSEASELARPKGDKKKRERGMEDIQY